MATQPVRAVERSHRELKRVSELEVVPAEIDPRAPCTLKPSAAATCAQSQFESQGTSVAHATYSGDRIAEYRIEAISANDNPGISAVAKPDEAAEVMSYLTLVGMEIANAQFGTRSEITSESHKVRFVCPELDDAVGRRRWTRRLPGIA